MVAYVQNMTCAPIHNKMIFDWKHQGGQGGAKNTTKEHFYGHDTAQTYQREPTKTSGHDAELTCDFVETRAVWGQCWCNSYYL